jgi:tetratricopeptide (TPR) repeat protein
VTLHELERFDEALASYDRALALRPDYAEAFFNRGVTLHLLRQVDEALICYDYADLESGLCRWILQQGSSVPAQGRLRNGMAGI